MTAQCATCGEPLDLKREEGLGAAVVTVFCPRCDQIAPDRAIAPVSAAVARGAHDGEGGREMTKRSGGSGRSGLGKLTAEIRSWVPEDTDEAIGTLAAMAGVSKSEYLRDLVMCHVHGCLINRLRQSSAQKGAGMAPE